MPILDKEFVLKNNYVSPRTNAVYDYEFIKALRDIPWAEWINTPDSFLIKEDYLTTFCDWISSSRLNRIEGLGSFPIRHLINGTTQTFDEAYHLHADKRLRFFRGEYAYHRRVVKNWAFLEDSPLSRGDYAVVSAPFCSTGAVHPKMAETLEQAEEMGIPVILDCAYFGTCHSLHINVNHLSIESISFSLTKGLGMGSIRSGIRFSRKDNGGPISQQNKYNHTVACAAKMGLYMMKRLPPDFIPDKYRKAQEEVCHLLGIHPTNTIHLALGNPDWENFLIDDAYYRLGIRDLVKAFYKKQLPLA